MVSRDTNKQPTIPFTYKHFIAALVVVAFSFQIGAFQVYGLELFTVLTFSQHITLVLASLPQALSLIVSAWLIWIFVDLFLNAFPTVKSQKLNTKIAKLRRKTIMLVMSLIIGYVGLKVLLDAVTLLGYSLGAFLVILAFSFRKILVTYKRAKSELRRVIEMFILTLMAIGSSAFWGLQHAYVQLDTYDLQDKICMENKCESVNTIMSFNNAVIYNNQTAVFYQSFENKAQVRIKIRDKVTVLERIGCLTGLFCNSQL